VSATAKLELKIGGMACALCVASIGKRLGGMRGVRDVDVRLGREEVLVEFEPRQVTPAQLKDTFLDLGFTVRAARKLASFRRIAFGVGMALLALTALALWQWQWDISPLEAWIDEHAVLGAAVYLVAVAASVVLLPLSSLPFLPFAAHLYGVWLTALLSAAGWWVGSLIAFQIARLGRRYLERLSSLETLDRLERRIPGDVGFGGIVILRMIFPVDIVSFALGLLNELRFSTYAIASLIGILPFALVWSYAGGALQAGRFLAFAAVAAGMTAAVLVIRRLWQARHRAPRTK
jgi:uncharacterized membrane protein YdjX (TVP38/TMEM64 family)/copper chaperone CopZ